jgi:hypothetical protein
MNNPALPYIPKNNQSVRDEIKMKKTGIPGIFIVLLIAVVMIAACTQAPEPGPDNIVIKYKSYGGFVMPTYAIQELVVTKNMSTLTVYSSDGNITERFEKNLTPEQFNSIVKVFTDNNFASYGDRYDEGQNHVTDVGFTDITFAANGKTKTVTTYNVNDYMPSGLIAIREKLQETVEYTRALDESQIKDLAESWIREAPTHKYDGSGLALVDYVQQESFPVRHVLTYNFTSSHAGYGDRSDQVTAQVITNHTIKVTIIDGNVDSAIIDGVWDEMDQFMIGSELGFSFQPMMCEKTPWQVWEENSGRVYIRAPTDEEIIKSYYITVYSTEVRDVKKVQSGTMTCQACDICPETYKFELNVDANERYPLVDEGWIRVG